MPLPAAVESFLNQSRREYSTFTTQRTRGKFCLPIFERLTDWSPVLGSWLLVKTPSPHPSVRVLGSRFLVLGSCTVKVIPTRRHCERSVAISYEGGAECRRTAQKQFSDTFRADFSRFVSDEIATASPRNDGGGRTRQESFLRGFAVFACGIPTGGQNTYDPQIVFPVGNSSTTPIALPKVHHLHYLKGFSTFLPPKMGKLEILTGLATTIFFRHKFSSPVRNEISSVEYVAESF